MAQKQYSDKNIAEHNFKNLTAEEQRKIASQGGKASVEARRQRKTLAQLSEMIGNLAVSSEKNREIMRQAGIKDEDMIRDTEAMFRLSLKAASGDTRAIELLAKLRGELGSDNPLSGVSVESITINFGKEK
jgi:hypothetical protein